jgi:hypothetical protein
MSLRVIIKPNDIERWIAERDGTPVRCGDDYRIAFEPADDEQLTVDELIEAMKFHHLVMLVDDEAGKTEHKIYRHG